MATPREVTGLSFEPRSLLVARPRPEEIPWRLLCLDQAKNDVENLTELMRIAKHGDQVLGGYLLEQPADDSLSWKILCLAVIPEARGQGLGHWLIGHAAGVAEARSAAEITIEIDETHRARSLFVRYGFEPVERHRLSFFTYSE